MTEQTFGAGEKLSDERTPEGSQAVPKGENQLASEDAAAELGAPESVAAEAPEPEAAQDTKTPQVRRAVRLAGNILFCASIAILIISVIVMVSSRMNYGIPSFFGVSIVTVESDSMHPSIPQGSLVAYRETPAVDIKTGDVITFSLTGESNITHRVVKVNKSDKETTFVTKGDANDTEDPNHVPYGSVKGVVVFSLPLLGYFVQFLRPPGYGLLIIVIIPAVIFIAFEVRKLIVLAKTELPEENQDKKKKS